MKKGLIVFGLIAALVMIPLAFAGTFDTSITPNGMSQGTLVRFLYNMMTTVNELAADHDADNATVVELVADHDADNDVVDGYKTAIDELGTDHDADNDVLDGYKTALDELMADHATFKTVVDDVKALANALQARYGKIVVQDGNLAISGVAAEKFKTTQTAYTIVSGITVSKAATDNLVFSAADTINTGAAAGDYWGVWRVEMDYDGTIYTNSPAADQTYADEATAIAAIPVTTANRVSLGYITVEANNGASWTANTDDMTPASDCQAANFYDDTEIGAPAAVSSSSPDTLAAGAVSSVAADLAATIPVSSVAADLTATSFAADLTADATLGSGTVSDPSISLTD